MKDNLSLLLKQAERLLDAQLDPVLREAELSVEQWRVLEILSAGDGLAMSDLAERAVLNLPALSKMVDRMVSRSLLFRAPDDADRRRVLVYISDRGMAIHRRLKPAVDASAASMTANMSETRLAQLKRLLAGFISDARSA